MKKIKYAQKKGYIQKNKLTISVLGGFVLLSLVGFLFSTHGQRELPLPSTIHPIVTSVVSPELTRSINNAPIQITKAPPIPTSKPATPTVTQTLQSNSSNQQTSQQTSGFHIDNVSPSSGNYGDTLTISGSGFGSTRGNVQFQNANGLGLNAGNIQSWTDNSIRVTSISFASNYDYSIVVIRSDNQSSNKVTFHSNQGQPQFSDFNAINPDHGYHGTSITITGRQFGNSQGSVNFYSENGYPNVVATGDITSWSDSNIVFNLPNALSPNTKYAFTISASTGSQSEVEFYTTGN